MKFTYHHLEDPEVRESMVALWNAENAELLAGGNRGECYGQDLVDAGWEQWEKAMPAALAEHDEEWLTHQMLDPSYWRSHRPRILKSGRVSQQAVSPRWVAPFLSRNEFNIAYIHGLSATLLQRGQGECEVYRADSAYEPRGECSAWEGQRFSTQEIFDGHRARYWPPEAAVPSVLSVPSGPNCHHSIRAVGAA